MVSEHDQVQQRKLRICIYGSTDAEPELESFVARLTYAILKALPSVIISGGVKQNLKVKKGKGSVDLAALEGAQQYVAETKDKSVQLKDCFWAWVPDPSRTTRPHIVRMSKKDGVTVKVLKQRSDLGRRLRMIRDIDLLVTVRGKVHTETVLEQALETDTPALPLWFTGGDSKKFWNQYKPEIQSWFPALSEKLVGRINRFRLDSPPAEHEQIIQLFIRVLASARVSRCLVLLPFDREHNRLYDEVVKPAVDRLMMAVRLDRRPGSTTINQNFSEALDYCRAVVADITQPNLSVMYEIGYAHAKGISPFLFCRRPISPEALPVYVAARNVTVVQDNDDLSEKILAYLQDVMREKRFE